MTAKAAVVGWPIQHSLSPVLHGYWLNHYGIDGEMMPVPARPDDFAAIIARLRTEGFVGANVTVPHKESAFALADKKSDRAELAGAANLLTFNKDGLVYAENTDAYGLAESIKESLGLGFLLGKTVTVLGAGGASRAVVSALKSPLGASKIYILNRNLERAAKLANHLSEFGSKTDLIPGTFENWSAVARNSALVVNATSAGMGDNPQLGIDLEALPKDAVVCDIVYKPLETPLLKAARARGLKAIDGLGMLMHQAVPSFAAFFGMTPEVTPGLRAALVKALNGG